MRQVFTSNRLENVEQVAQILRDAGIEVRVTNGRSYNSGRRRTFSYTDRSTGTTPPAVWVVRSADRPRARELMQELGFSLPTTRPTHSYLPGPESGSIVQDAKPAPTVRQRKISRYRLLLLAVIAFLVMLVMLRMF